MALGVYITLSLKHIIINKVTARDKAMKQASGKSSHMAAICSFAIRRPVIM